MKQLPGFKQDFSTFVREECRIEADLILSDKDPPLKEFNMETLKNFSYNSCLTKLEKNAPTLIASIAGSISDSKSDQLEHLSRKGFGGRRRDDSVSLIPAIVQTASAILHNRHPNSISTVPAINSLNNYTNHITSRYFYLSNSLGISYSKKKTKDLVDQVNEDHAWEILEMKEEVESMLSTSKTNREKRARAAAGAFGFSMFGDNVGKVVVPRHNTGLANKGQYLMMAITLGAVNRIPTAHLSDTPVIKPKDVDFFPAAADLSRITGWMKYQIGVIMVKYHPVFAKCSKFNRPPDISYASKMKLKSKVSVLSLSLEDPASNDGMIKISEKIVPFVPSYPCGLWCLVTKVMLSEAMVFPGDDVEKCSLRKGWKDLCSCHKSGIRKRRTFSSST